MSEILQAIITVLLLAVLAFALSHFGPAFLDALARVGMLAPPVL